MQQHANKLLLKFFNMKKILLLAFLFVLINNIGNSQTNYSPTGTWRYVNGTDTVEIYLKQDQFTLNGTTHSILIGFHRYVKNGVLMENTMGFTNTTYNNNQYSIITFDDNPNNVRVDGHLKDVSLNNKRYIIFTKVNTTTMNVRLTYIQGVRNNRPYGFTLPRNFQLIKQ